MQRAGDGNAVMVSIDLPNAFATLLFLFLFL